MIIEYSSNNSGGNWWLTDEDWYALEKAGWDVKWFKTEDNFIYVEEDGRFLGALASKASKKIKDPKKAIREFEDIVGKSLNEEGCSCCGAPHSFNWTDDIGAWNYIEGTDIGSFLWADL